MTPPWEEAPVVVHGSRERALSRVNSDRNKSERVLPHIRLLERSIERLNPLPAMLQYILFTRHSSLKPQLRQLAWNFVLAPFFIETIVRVVLQFITSTYGNMEDAHVQGYVAQPLIRIAFEECVLHVWARSLGGLVAFPACKNITLKWYGHLKQDRWREKL